MLETKSNFSRGMSDVDLLWLVTVLSLASNKFTILTEDDTCWIMMTVVPVADIMPFTWLYTCALVAYTMSYSVVNTYRCRYSVTFSSVWHSELA